MRPKSSSWPRTSSTLWTPLVTMQSRHTNTPTIVRHWSQSNLNIQTHRQWYATSHNPISTSNHSTNPYPETSRLRILSAKKHALKVISSFSAPWHRFYKSLQAAVERVSFIKCWLAILIRQPNFLPRTVFYFRKFFYSKRFPHKKKMSYIKKKCPCHRWLSYFRKCSYVWKSSQNDFLI